MDLAAGLRSDRTGPLDPMGRARTGPLKLPASIADHTLWRSCHGETVLRPMPVRVSGFIWRWN